MQGDLYVGQFTKKNVEGNLLRIIIVGNLFRVIC